MSANTLAVIGGGWAGIAAAVTARRAGWQVSLYEMAPQLGGRARSFGAAPQFDNGQHILIGAYVDTLNLMRTVGVDIEQALLRRPLTLQYPDGSGLRLPPGPALLSFARAVLSNRAWSWPVRIRLLQACSSWAIQGFQCDASFSVRQLCHRLPQQLMADLVDPLCVAALNTPASEASAAVFLRVLKDALFRGPGASDLLLPRTPLSQLLAQPAENWLREQGCELLLAHRVSSLAARQNGGWTVDDKAFDRVILACSSVEAARLAEPIAPDWARTAEALRFEPIITVYLESPGSRFPAPMMALRESDEAPAQFAFDLGQLGLAPGRFAFVISGASLWTERGLDAAGEATLAQARKALDWLSPPQLLKTLAEKRATFACTPGLQRPDPQLTAGLWAAGDYVDGPYPATLEGAVRSGLAAADGLGAAWQNSAAR
ncbi:hydroxysqualene dehydroxylase HpnE [Roseateles sp.]|jgi:squalene-associated FAD-dependent desaturase|uniref:hydroxysqualene dehydroxylase HpnE n=1 Tax=Roseateles sp. TaxID=1971397 RepID=UPI0037C9B639